MYKRQPPIAEDTTYSGMKTESSPNAISWKKNPSRHIARHCFKEKLKPLVTRGGFLFGSLNYFINRYEEASGEISRETPLFSFLRGTAYIGTLDSRGKLAFSK